MRKLIYGMGVSLDGYIAAPGNDIGWTVPDEELHRFHNQQARDTGVQLYGRRLYDTMRYWETADQNPAAHEVELEFAQIWKATPKIVFSRSLASVEGTNTTLMKDGAVDEVLRLKQQPGKDLACGGAGLASTFMKADLIDEYRLYISPVLLGAGTPFFATLDKRIELELVETRAFASRVVYERYRRAAKQPA
jgi:dihydrofolate reductase